KAKLERISASQEARLKVKMLNIGSEVAEDVDLTLFIVSSFNFEPPTPEYYTGISTRYPDKIYIGTPTTRKIQPGQWHSTTIPIVAPATLGNYELECAIFERKLGRTRHFLTHEVA